MNKVKVYHSDCMPCIRHVVRFLGWVEVKAPPLIFDVDPQKPEELAPAVRILTPSQSSPPTKPAHHTHNSPTTTTHTYSSQWVSPTSFPRLAFTCSTHGSLPAGQSEWCNPQCLKRFADLYRQLHHRVRLLLQSLLARLPRQLPPCTVTLMSNFGPCF